MVSEASKSIKKMKKHDKIIRKRDSTLSCLDSTSPTVFGKFEDIVSNRKQSAPVVVYQSISSDSDHEQNKSSSSDSCYLTSSYNNEEKVKIRKTIKTSD